MGRATVIDGGKDGRYRIRVDYGSDRLQARLDAIDERLAELGDFDGIGPGLIRDARLDLAAVESEEAQEPYVEAVDAASVAYSDAVDAACTPEGWSIFAVEEEMDALRAAAEAQAANTDAIYQYTRAKGAAEINIEQDEAVLAELGPLFDAAESSYDSARQSYESALETYGEELFYCDNNLPQCDPDAIAQAYADLQAWDLIVQQRRDDMQDIQDWVVYWENKLAEHQADLEQAESDLAAEQELTGELDADYRAALQAYNDAVAAMTSVLTKCDPAQFIDELNALNEAMLALYEIQSLIPSARAALALLQAEWTTLSADRDALESLADKRVTREQDAWCADLSEHASGEVATIEIPDEPGTILIAPGGRDPEPDDGHLMLRELCSGPQSYFNAGVLPGVQRWNPRYRLGKTTKIDVENNTADVDLRDVRSSAQDLEINGAEKLSDVPIRYMDCDAAAFSVGDDVVIEFERDWGSATVIGFEHDPRACCEWPETFTMIFDTWVLLQLFDFSLLEKFTFDPFPGHSLGGIHAEYDLICLESGQRRKYVIVDIIEEFFVFIFIYAPADMMQNPADALDVPDDLG